MNYTKEATKQLIEAYQSGTSIEDLEKEFNKSRRSIIGKLSREGVYQKKEYKSKDGRDPVTKLEIVIDIAEKLEVPELIGLEKTPKETLRIIQEKLSEITQES